MSMWKEWLIDASLESGIEGIFAFVPLDGENVITGYTEISDCPPSGGKLVGVWHYDPELVPPFIERHKDEIAELKRLMGVSA